MTAVDAFGIVYALGAFLAAAAYCLYLLRRTFAGQPFTGDVGGYLFVVIFWPIAGLRLMTTRSGAGS